MSDPSIRSALEQTLDDFRLSRTERSALRQLLDGESDLQRLALYRSQAFDLAREQLSVTNSSLVLEWLESVVKALQPQPAKSQAEIAEACFSPQDNCVHRIEQLIHRTKQQLDICVFTITDDRLTEAVIAAASRGVTTRLITDNDKSEDLGSDADMLARRGVSVRMDQTRYHMHHKFALFDQQVLLTGSYNWTRSAAENNEENFVVTNQTQLIRSFSSLFEQLWQDFADSA